PRPPRAGPLAARRVGSPLAIGSRSPSPRRRSLVKFAARSKSNQLAPTKARSAGGKSRRTSPLVREPAGFVGSAPRLGASPPSYAPGIQTKLKVGKPNDRFEQEADRVAEQVVRT